MFELEIMSPVYIYFLNHKQTIRKYVILFFPFFAFSIVKDR